MWLKQTDVEGFSLILFFLKNAGRTLNWHQLANSSNQLMKPLELELKWKSPLRVRAQVGLFLALASPWKPEAKDKEVLSCHPTAGMGLPLVLAIWLFSVSSHPLPNSGPS